MEMVSTMKKILLIGLMLVFVNVEAFAQNIYGTWPEKLSAETEKLMATFKGEMGIYIEDLKTHTKFSYNAGQRYYLASAIKLFVMIEIFKLVSESKLLWTDQVKIVDSKYRDGAGYVNWIPVGKKISIKKLVKFMMTKSDNAATDILIDIAGLDTIDDTARNYGVWDLGTLTTLLDVRRDVYRVLHPLAGNLTALDYIELWKIRNNFPKKLRLFARMIGKPKLNFSHEQLAESFEKFYNKGSNSASLTAVADLLKKLSRGEIISTEMSQSMIDLLKKCKTGKRRIKKGLPQNWAFAHKTGTQHKRICDVGIAYGTKTEEVLMLMCAQDFDEMKNVEAAFAKISSHYIKFSRPPLIPKETDKDFWANKP